MNKKSMWSFKISTATLVLIPAAVGINFVGKSLVLVLRLPLWLDCIGTILTSLLCGPIAGAICALATGLVNSLSDPVSFFYSIVGILVALAIGIANHNDRINSFGKALILSFIVVLIATVGSTPINMILWEGQTANIWGDAAYVALIANKCPVLLASLVDEFLVDLPDKIASVLIAYGIFKALPKKLTILYKNDNDVTSL